jgi:acetylornithine deacetylase/succinyl-diaminopimelate desuccinylase-like protein
MRSFSLILVVVTLSVAAAAQITPPQAAHTYTASRQAELTQQFSDLLAIPNVAADPASLHRNAEFLVTQLQQRGVEAKLLTAPGLPSTTPPLVFGEIKTPGAQRTIVFYAHYDGQPVTHRSGTPVNHSRPW